MPMQRADGIGTGAKLRDHESTISRRMEHSTLGTICQLTLIYPRQVIRSNVKRFQLGRNWHCWSPFLDGMDARARSQTILRTTPETRASLSELTTMTSVCQRA